jgi:hypothetical protein
MINKNKIGPCVSCKITDLGFALSILIIVKIEEKT